MNYANAAHEAGSPGDRLALVGNIVLIVLGIAVGLFVLAILAYVASYVFIVVGPIVLIAAFFAWVFGANWAGGAAGIGGVLTVVGMVLAAHRV